MNTKKVSREQWYCILHETCFYFLKRNAPMPTRPAAISTNDIGSGISTGGGGSQSCTQTGGGHVPVTSQLGGGGWQSCKHTGGGGHECVTSHPGGGGHVPVASQLGGGGGGGTKIDSGSSGITHSIRGVVQITCNAGNTGSKYPIRFRGPESVSEVKANEFWGFCMSRLLNEIPVLFTRFGGNCAV